MNISDDRLWQDGGCAVGPLDRRGTIDSFTVVDPASRRPPRNGVRARKPIAPIWVSIGSTSRSSRSSHSLSRTVLPAYVPITSRTDAYALSIAAGLFDRSPGACAWAALPVVRVMPNLPAAVGQGVSWPMCAAMGGRSALTAGSCVRTLMERTGTVVIVDDEDKLDRVTAVAGIGSGLRVRDRTRLRRRRDRPRLHRT